MTGVAEVLATCDECGKPVEMSGPRWSRISSDPTRNRYWHLACRDRVLRDQQEQFRIALEVLSKAGQSVAHLSKSVDELKEILGVHR